MRFLTTFCTLKDKLANAPVLTLPEPRKRFTIYSDASLVISIAFSCLWTKLCLYAKTASIFVFKPTNSFSRKLPMCSSRGRLWISWGYAHDLRMMCQLAMALMVCGNTRFRQSSACCQVSGGLTGHGGGQTGWRSDRPLAGGQTGRGFSVSFELGQK